MHRGNLTTKEKISRAVFPGRQQDITISCLCSENSIGCYAKILVIRRARITEGRGRLGFLVFSKTYLNRILKFFPDGLIKLCQT